MHRISALKFSFLLILLFLSGITSAQFYYGSNQDFGKNRVQHNDFLWQHYRFENFRTYFYAGGRGLAQYTAKVAPVFIRQLEDMFDFQYDGRIEFIIYNCQSHFRENNVGLNNEEENNIGGVTRIMGSKVFLYYEGDYKLLDEQIKAGIADVLIKQMMYGGNWKDVVKNSALLTMPEWFHSGAVEYVSKGWNAEVETRVRDAFSSGKFDNFNYHTGEDAALAGHSIWNFIGEVYGDKLIPNILYMTRIARNVESGFLFVLGLNLKSLTEEYHQFYKSKYEREERLRETISLSEVNVKKHKKNEYVTQFKLSTDGAYAAYVTNILGQYRIWVVDRKTGKRSRMARGEHKMLRIPDRSFPVIQFHPNNKNLACFIQKKGKILLRIYSLEGEETFEKEVFGLDQVLDFGYSHQGNQMVLSATQHGQTDLYLYSIGSNAKLQLTNDIYTDLHPQFVGQTEEIVFSSNRPDDTLRVQTTPRRVDRKKDIFLLSVKEPRSLTRLTHSPNVDETMPAEYAPGKFTYLGDGLGLRNRYVARIDSAISYIDTAIHYRYFSVEQTLSNLDRGILQYQFNKSSGEYAALLQKDGRYRLHYGYIDDDEVKTNLPDFRALNKNLVEQFLPTTGSTEPVPTDPEVSDTSETVKVEIDIYNYRFEGEGPVPVAKPAPLIDNSLQVASPVRNYQQMFDYIDSTIVFPNQRNYNINFTVDEIVTQLDNSFLNPSYQPFNPGNTRYQNPGLSGLLGVKMNDLFEDYKFTGGARFSLNLNGSEYLLRFENLRQRLDKTYTFHRQSITTPSATSPQRQFTHQLMYSAKWPFNEVLAVKGTGILRNDRLIALGVDDRTLQIPDRTSYQAGLKGELIYDNTLYRGLNLRSGTRMKGFAEYYHGERKYSTMVVLGMDIRDYRVIHRNIIWANRIASSTSLGPQKLVYYLGGVDNPFFFPPKFDESINIAMDKGYAFQTIATPMRGFYQNARNGNNFVLANTEIRFPVLKYFIQRPLKSDFLTNFQIVPFADVGSAWSGPDPYSDDNSVNTEVITQAPLTITLTNNKDPFVFGYGMGLRSRLWGYFVRLDWAWGYDDRHQLPGEIYLSLNLDF